MHQTMPSFIYVHYLSKATQPLLEWFLLYPQFPDENKNLRSRKGLKENEI